MEPVNLIVNNFRKFKNKSIAQTSAVGFTANSTRVHAELGVCEKYACLGLNKSMRKL